MLDNDGGSPKRRQSGGTEVERRVRARAAVVVPPDGGSSDAPVDEDYLPQEDQQQQEQLQEEGHPQQEEDSAGLHQALVGAILDVGMKHSSPAVIMEEMIQHPPGMTSERVKSHLQKFRQAKQREREAFLEEYERFSANLRAVEAFHPRAASLEIRSTRDAFGGTAAAIVTHAARAASRRAPEPRQQRASLFADGAFSLGRLPSNEVVAGLLASPHNEHNDDSNSTTHYNGEIRMPDLSEEERETPLGQSMGLVHQIIEHMTDHLLRSRVG